MNNILGSFKRLKANATEGGKPYREETVEYKDTIGDLNVLVRQNCEPHFGNSVLHDLVQGVYVPCVVVD